MGVFGVFHGVLEAGGIFVCLLLKEWRMGVFVTRTVGEWGVGGGVNGGVFGE